MVDRSERHRRIIERVDALYRRIDSELGRDAELAGSCKACGKCCDFDAYDHRLFVTPPELIYLAAGLGQSELKPMTTGRCPYNEHSRCTVHEHRFAGCRIFCCTGNADFQSDLTEEVLKELKAICTEFEVPYRYMDLHTALNSAAISTQ
jgi:Fe-S-cluster containining protein